MNGSIVPDVASEDKELVALSPSDFVRDAARLMKHRQVGSVLIILDNALVGIFTERDLVYRIVAEGLDPDLTPLHEVMTRSPDTIEANSDPVSALRMMQDRGYRHLPITRDGNLIGIVSRRDFFYLENKLK
tara:strand:- start:12 stop:404 length:393 start_codon:yes stop_codon:yes gene_type:complete